MNFNKKYWVAVLGLVAANTSSVIYAENMRPGLWEFTSKMSSQSGEMEAAMQAMEEAFRDMPAEQRRQMEKMMAAQGMQMSTPKAGAQIVKVCITPEEAAQMDMQSDPNCKQQILQRSGNTVRIRFSCAGEIRNEGEGTFTFSGDTAFTGSMAIRTMAAGQSDQMTLSQSGKWLGANCGALGSR